MADPQNDGTSLKVSRGDPMKIPAAWVNQTTETNRWVARQQTSSQSPPAEPPLPPQPTQVVVIATNNSGDDRKVGEILGLTGNALGNPTSSSQPTDPKLCSFINNPIMTGEKPTLASDFNNFGVCLEPIRKGKSGRICISGLCAAQVNCLNTSDVYADVTDNDATQLTSGSDGAAYIVEAVNAGSGKQWCWVILGKGIMQGAPFYVSVKQNGGVSGTNKTVSCTWTYDLYPLGNTSGTKYNTSVLTPKQWRFTVTQYTAGTLGLAVRDLSGNLVLLQVFDEVPNSASC